MKTRSVHFVRLALLTLVLLLGAGACSNDDGGSVTTEGSSSGTGTGSGTGSGSGSGSGSGAAGDVETVAAGKLTVCSDIPYAPFEFEQNGQVVGIDADLMRGVAKELKLEATFQDTDFDGIFAALAARKCDVVASSVSITDERKKNSEFTKGYFEINQSLLVRKGDESRYSDLPALEGKTVGVQAETTGADFAAERAKDAGFVVKEFGDAAELFAALQAKQIEAVLQDLPVNAYNAATTGQTAVSKTFTETEKEEYGFVVRKGNTALRDAVDDALQHLRDDGEYDKILAKYLGESTKS